MRIKLKPEDITVIVDSREQKPLDLGNFKTITSALVTGDYSLKHRERQVAVERKSIQDLVNCLGHDRERFFKEVERLRGMTSKMILVEGSELDIRKKNFKGNIEIASILSSVIRIVELGVPVYFAGNREYASDILRRFLYLNAQRSWFEQYPLIGEINGNQEENNKKNREKNKGGSKGNAAQEGNPQGETNQGSSNIPG